MRERDFSFAANLYNDLPRELLEEKTFKTLSSIHLNIICLLIIQEFYSILLFTVFDNKKMNRMMKNKKNKIN